MMEDASTQDLETGEILAQSKDLRALVLELWQRVRMDWGYASDQLSNAFRAQKMLSSASRRSVAESLYAMIRRLRAIDHAISLGGRVADRDRDAVRLWATLVLEFGLPVSKVAAPGVLDWQKIAAARESIARERKPVKRLGLEASLPDWLASQLHEQHGEESFELGVELSRRAPMTVRVNTIRISRDELIESLQRDGFEVTPGAHSATALTFESRTNLFALPQFRAGLFEAQDEGSQLIAELVAPPPKAKVVDFCAGAGGKTLALAAMMGNRGRIIACDVSKKKLVELRRRAKRAGVDNVASATLVDDPLEAMPKPLRAWERGAHRVLVDAPCTGVGALRRNPEIRWRLQEADLARFPQLQLEILERSLDLVAPGGRLIYATCSVLRQENQGVAEALLARHADLVLVPPKEIWGREKAMPLSDDTEQYMELLPNRHGCDGFFAAVFRRLPSETKGEGLLP